MISFYSLLRLAGNAFHAEHHLQRHGHIDRIDGVERRGVELFLDVLPRRFRPVIFRQAPYQAAHIGERFSGHDGRNFERPR
jgi:hypothetical protein